MSERLWKYLRELVQGPDFKQAQRIEQADLAVAEAGTVHPLLVAEQDDLARRPAQALPLGEFKEGVRRRTPLRARHEDLLAHQHVIGVSGSGKSFFVLHELIALLEGRAVNSLLVLDMKGELAELMTDVALPMIASKMPRAEADAFLKRIVVIDPFSATNLPPLNVLVRDPGLPIAIQARDVAECFEAATESSVTSRMETILDWVLRLVIEVGGSFHTVRRALQEPAVLEALVRQSKDPEVVRYFVLRFPVEPKASKLALLARLDRFLALPETQLTMGASVCLDFDALLRDRIVIVSLGRAPAGLQSVARFFAMVILTRLARAIFRLPPRGHGFASLLVADEWQVALNSALALEFESILTLARSRGVHLWLAHQQLSQLDRHGAALKSVVLGETAVQVAFRLAQEDARALRYLFPVTGTMRRRAGVAVTNTSPFLSASEEVEARIVAAGRLPNREGYWFDRRKPWGAVPFKSAELVLPAVSSLPQNFVAQARTGAITFTKNDLTRMRDAEDARLTQLAAGPPRARAASAPPPAAPSAPTLPTTPTTSTPASPPQPPRPPQQPPRRPGPRRGGGRGGSGLPPIR